MPSPNQDSRPVKVYTALPDNTLLFSSLSGTERVSELFEYDLVLVSENAEIDPADLLGTDLTVELELPAGGSRFFHGYVADCADAPGEGELVGYELSIRPWLWFLTRTADCRIFQDTSVPDIIRQILGEEGFTDVESDLTESYRPWTYCVQYRETDFNFISRLMEQEGIHYYFRHEQGLHTLVLGDGGSGHQTFPNYAEVPLFPPDGMEHRDRDHLSEWCLRKHLRPGRFAVRDFNFEMPDADLELQASSTTTHARFDFEVYDYPGEYPEREAGRMRARLLLEESDTQHEHAGGAGNVRGLLAGNCFTLTGAERERDNREYLVTGTECSFASSNFRSGSEGSLKFHCQITATGSDRPYRAPRRTPKPFVQGPQTAMVVGPSGEEIWTDKYGRVKLQFHWDRYGISDENSSCWVRVSQLWAGQGWGAMHVPRIGHEVIVEFLEGDPDRPIITGRVYNGDNPVPHALPANATQSGIKSRSSAGGNAANFNEIRMEDKKGEEELYIHAEKTHTNVTEESRSESVGADRSLSVGHDKSETIGNDKTITVDGKHTETIDKATEIKIKTGSYTHKVLANTATYTVKGKVTETYSDAHDTIVAKEVLIDSTGKTVTIHAADSIKLHSGAASIELKKDGTILISGKTVSITGTAEASVGVGTQNVKYDNAKVTTSGAAISTTAVGVHELTGALIKIN